MYLLALYNDLDVIHTDIKFGPKTRHLITSNRDQVVTNAGLKVRVELAGDKLNLFGFDTEMR